MAQARAPDPASRFRAVVGGTPYGALFELALTKVARQHGADIRPASSKRRYSVWLRDAKERTASIRPEQTHQLASLEAVHQKPDVSV
jgi:hypothetical protein